MAAGATARRSRDPRALLVAGDPALAFAAARCLTAAGQPWHLVAQRRSPTLTTMRGCVGQTRLPDGALDGPAATLPATLGQLLGRFPEAVVVPTGMDVTCALAASALPPENLFPLSPAPLLRELHDKWALVPLLDRLGLHHPETRLLQEATDVDDVDLEFPLIVKPLDAEASHGVRRVTCREELRRNVARVAAAGLMPVLVQRCIEGADMGVSVLADHGRVRACRVQEPDGRGGLFYRDRLDALRIGEALVEGTGFHGVANIDLRREATTDRLFVLECNPRLYATVHKSAYAGANMVDLGLRMARGEVFSDVPAVAGHVPAPGDALRQLVAVRRARRFPSGSRQALLGELRDPVSSVLRAAEWRSPRLWRRLTGGAEREWELFDAADSPSAERVTGWN